MVTSMNLLKKVLRINNEKIILTTLTLFILFAFSLVAILSTIGIETDKFNNLIIKKISQTNNKINLKIDKINFLNLI